MWIRLRSSCTHFFGESHITANPTENDFTMGYGGGVDVKANDKVDIRVVQFDWTPVHSSSSTGSSWTKNVIRFGFGIVLKSGQEDKSL